MSHLHTHMVRKCCHDGCPAQSPDLVALTEDSQWWFCADHACTSPEPLRQLT